MLCLWLSDETTVICIAWRKFAWPQELWFQKSYVNTILVIFLNWQGVMHKELVLEGQTVNCELYRAVIDRPMKRVQCSWLDKAQFGNWFLLHDNAPYHNTVSSIIVSQRKMLLLLTTTLTCYSWHLQTTFNSLNWNPALRSAVSAPFQTQCDKWIKECYSSWVLWRHSAVLQLCQ